MVGEKQAPVAPQAGVGGGGGDGGGLGLVGGRVDQHGAGRGQLIEEDVGAGDAARVDVVEVGARIIAVVLKPSSVAMPAAAAPKAGLLTTVLPPVAGSSRKSDGSGILPAFGSVSTCAGAERRDLEGLDERQLLVREDAVDGLERRQVALAESLELGAGRGRLGARAELAAGPGSGSRPATGPCPG